MHRTMFDTPIINTILRSIALLWLRLAGWKVKGEVPKDLRKCVMIAAPHTSNWDLPYTLLISFALRINIYWMGKEQIFKFPFRGTMKWLGGVPVNREKSTNLVQASIDQMNEQEQFVIIVPPEGTRSKVTKWKTGFYHIAQGAGVPILLGFLDFERKEGGVLGTFDATGDVDKDIEEIRKRYSHISGRKAEQFDKVK